MLVALASFSSLPAEVNLAGRLVLGGVFVLAGAAKAFRFNGFLVTLSSLGIPATLAALLTPAIIIIEILLGFAILLDLLQVFTAGSAAVLLATFAMLGIRAERTHLDVPCSCFGVSKEPLGYVTALRALLLGLTIVVLASTQSLGVLSIHAWEEGVSAALAAALALALGRWFLATPRLYALIAERRRPQTETTPSMPVLPHRVWRNW